MVIIDDGDDDHHDDHDDDEGSGRYLIKNIRVIPVTFFFVCAFLNGGR